MASRAHDVSVVNKWHDLAGYGILVLVFIGTMAIAWRLGRQRETTRPQDNGTTRQQDRGPVVSGQWSHGPAWKRLLALCSLLFAWLLAVEIGVEAWYRMHELTTIPTAAWSVRWPEDAPGYREIKTDERVRELLRFDSADEALWRTHNLAVTNYMLFVRWYLCGSTVVAATVH